MKTLAAKIQSAYRTTGIKAIAFVERNANSILFVVGLVILVGGLHGVANAQDSYATPEYDPSLVRSAVGNLFCLIEGAFGALIMVVSGLGAIVAAAMGAYRAAVGMLVVAVGSFILRALVSLFFGTDFNGEGVSDC